MDSDPASNAHFLLYEAYQTMFFVRVVRVWCIDPKASGHTNPGASGLATFNPNIFCKMISGSIANIGESLHVFDAILVNKLLYNLK